MARKVNIINSLRRMGYSVTEDGGIIGVSLKIGDLVFYHYATEEDIELSNFPIEDLIVSKLNHSIVNHFKEVN